MQKSNKPFPLAFCIFTFIVIFVPANILAPVELTLLTPIRLINSVTSSKNNKTKRPIKKNNTANDNQPATITELQKEINELKNDYNILANENRELRSKLSNIANFIETQPSALKIHEQYELILANVFISNDSTSWRKSITIDRGISSGITPGLPVISGKYLVGKIAECGPFESRIQLLTDPLFKIKAFVKSNNSNPDAKDKKTPKPEEVNASASGILEGKSLNKCILRWISRETPVDEDWIAMSSSDITGLYPRGLLIGKVDYVEPESYFHRIDITPILDFNNLESVVVLRKK
jgi:rod shape-determining protein MreC